MNTKDGYEIDHVDTFRVQTADAGTSGSERIWTIGEMVQTMPMVERLLGSPAAGAPQGGVRLLRRTGLLRLAAGHGPRARRSLQHRARLM